MGNGFATLTGSAGLAPSARRLAPAQPATRPFSSDTVCHCACCGRPLASDSVAAQTITKHMTLSWCAECHAGQHYLNFGLTAGEVTR